VSYRYYHHCRHYHARPPRWGGAGKRLLYILAVGVVVAAGVSVFRARSDRYVSPRPAPAKMAGMSPHRLQTYAADNGVLGGADAAQKALAALPPQGPDANRTVPVGVNLTQTHDHGHAAVAAGGRPTPDRASDRPTPAIRLHVRSDSPHPSRELAINDAVAVARVEIAEALRALDPPVAATPSWEKVRYQYLKPESVKEVQPSEADKAAWAEKGIDPNRVWAEIDVEVTEDQVRELRAEHRVGAAGWVGAAAFVVMLALYGFLRLDTWTKGYLTAALAAGIVAAAGAAVALLLLAR
jgi:hypothetical protein